MLVSRLTGVPSGIGPISTSPFAEQEREQTLSDAEQRRAGCPARTPSGTLM